MATTDEGYDNLTMTSIVQSLEHQAQSDDVEKLISELTAGNMSEITPVLNGNGELGFSYPGVESLLAMKTTDVVSLCESLVADNVLEKHLRQRITVCPKCHSANLRGSFLCPKCSSHNISRGRILEHFACGNITVEDEYKVDGQYICPKCKNKLRFIGTDYRSAGINYMCHDCRDMFEKAVTAWQCAACAESFSQDDAHYKELYSYKINLSNNQQDWLHFESGMKAQFIQVLNNLGYDIAERAIGRSTSDKSGVDHALNILARKDNGFLTYTVGIAIVFNSQAKEVSLAEVFRFDEKAVSLGIRDKIMIVTPKLSQDAMLFAQQQRIRVYEPADLENYMATLQSSRFPKSNGEPFRFESRTKFLAYLESLGYRIEPWGTIEGKSGALRTFDVLSYYNDGIISHTIGICILSSTDPVHLDTVVLFNAKACDAAIHDKVLLVSSSLSHEAKQYAKKQNIVVREIRSSSPSE